MKLSTEIVTSVFPQFSNRGLIQKITRNADLRKFKTNEIIIDPGMPVPFVPLIVEGNLRVMKVDEESGHELLLYYLKSGETCATSLSCCMSHSESEVEVVAEEDSLVLGIPLKFIDSWMNDYPEWRNFIMQTYKQKFDELLETVNSIAFTQLDERLVKYLKEQTFLHSSNILKTSHQEIAVKLNSSREVISRLLKQMEKRNMVSLSRNTIEVKNLDD
ncbi:MAG: Crp/Fnr family transcriptional regulator [Schleiferiaceae bacterium]|nr:Crp/Fnr family transcriptional regulator [Schleiferiaceae bacterium]